MKERGDTIPFFYLFRQREHKKHFASPLLCLSPGRIRRGCRGSRGSAESTFSEAQEEQSKKPAPRAGEGHTEQAEVKIAASC